MLIIEIKTTKQKKSLFPVYYIIFILHVNKARLIKGKKSFSVRGIWFGCFLESRFSDIWPTNKACDWALLVRQFDGEQQHPILLDPRVTFGVRRAILGLGRSK